MRRRTHAGRERHQGIRSPRGRAVGATGAWGASVTDVIYSRGENPDYTMGVIQPRTATLMTMAQEVLVRLRNAAAESGVKLPTRQFVYPTGVPADCEQVAVIIGGWVGAPPQEGLTNCIRFRWCAQIGVVISRCTPAMPTARTSSAPPVEKMNQAAEIASADAELLLRVISGFGEMGADVVLTTPEPEGGY